MRASVRVYVCATFFCDIYCCVFSLLVIFIVSLFESVCVCVCVCVCVRLFGDIYYCVCVCVFVSLEVFFFTYLF